MQGGAVLTATSVYFCGAVFVIGKVRQLLFYFTDFREYSHGICGPQIAITCYLRT